MFSKLLTAVGVSGLLLPASLAIGTHVASAQPNSYNVFVGYADTLRPSAPVFPTPFNTDPAAGVTDLGRPAGATSPGNDSGAIRVINTSGVAETVNNVTVTVGSSVFSIWPANVVVQSFGQLVYDETSGNNFDTSDAPTQTCTPDGITPEVSVTVNGVATTYADSGQILNTGGIDPGLGCNTTHTAENESQQWVSIGSATCPAGAVLTLAPASQSRPVGTTASVTANFEDCGNALTGADVGFKVMSGPNAGKTGSAIVDNSGNATFTYPGIGGAGTDVVQAGVINAGGLVASNTVNVVWTPQLLSGRAFGLQLSGLIRSLRPPIPARY